jgi:hypothetical protein
MRYLDPDWTSRYPDPDSTSRYPYSLLVLSREAVNTNVIVFSLTRPPTSWVGVRITTSWVGVRITTSSVGVRITTSWVGVRITTSWVGVRITTSWVSRIFIVLGHWNNNPLVDMSPHSERIAWPRLN